MLLKMKKKIYISSANNIREFRLGNDDEDGSENVAKKINLHPFKLYRVLFFLELNS